MSEDTIYPRQIGGNLGDAYITCFDYQFTTSIERLLVGGRSQSQDVTSHVDSGFLTYEDTKDYMMIWAKEIFFTTWPSFKLVDCSINIGSNYVYAVTTDPLQMVMLNGVDGSLMHSKVLYCA